MIKAGIFGVSGYAGAQLLWLLLNHKEVEVKFIAAYSSAGKEVTELYGSYRDVYKEKCLSFEEANAKIDEIDVLFTALPHGKSAETVALAYSKGVKVIDLGADFRIENEELYEFWYGTKFHDAKLMEHAVYGLPELKREKIKNAKIVANPGCYATASILGSYPLVKNGLVEEDLIIDAKSGTSGAGREGKVANLYCEVNETIKAYGVASHRHTAEIEQELGLEGKVCFTPHLIPMNRGILSVIYGRLKDGVSEEDVFNAYKNQYENEYFLRLCDGPTETRWVKGTNFCDIGIKVDMRTKKVIVMSVIDNLMKGAASQAVQNMNILFDLDEKAGLELIAMFP